MALFELDGKRVATPANCHYWVAANAIVAGQVRIEEDVSIWFNCVIRGDNEPIHIGARANIQDGCVLHTDLGLPLTIGPDCTIGHMVMLHGCTIGAGSLIGIGAIVLNGARIGGGSLIGAGALIAEGKVIAPRSVVLGSPGKIVRQVDDADLERVRLGAEFYAHNWKRFASGMKPQAD